MNVLEYTKHQLAATHRRWQPVIPSFEVVYRLRCEIDVVQAQRQSICDRNATTSLT